MEWKVESRLKGRVQGGSEGTVVEGSEREIQPLMELIRQWQSK